MKLWIRMLIVTLVLGLPAFALGPVLWPPTPDMTPTAQQLPYFMFISAMWALLFGFGVSFAFFGWKLVKKTDEKHKGMTVAMFIALIWLMVSWWPHDNLHIHNGLNMQGLLYIEYGFHVTLIISSLLIANYVWGSLKHDARH